MPSEVTVTTDPLIVYGMVGLLFGAVVLALIFARPRRDMGAATKSDAAQMAPGDGAWMPGGDIFDNERPAAEPEPLDEPPTYPSFPGASPGAVPPAVHDPWSSSPTVQGNQRPRWDKP